MFVDGLSAGVVGDGDGVVAVLLWELEGADSGSLLEQLLAMTSSVIADTRAENFLTLFIVESLRKTLFHKLY